MELTLLLYKSEIDCHSTIVHTHVDCSKFEFMLNFYYRKDNPKFDMYALCYYYLLDSMAEAFWLSNLEIYCFFLSHLYIHILLIEIL